MCCMAVKGNLHTIQDNHAIKEAVISFTVFPQIEEPLIYKDLLERDLSRYHKFEKVRLKELKVSANINETTVESIKDVGFKMISFKEGKASDVIQCLRQPPFGIFTFNTINYKDWRSFKSDRLSDAKSIANFQNRYSVKAFSLMYIDEFYFEDEKEYDPKVLFNLESRNLPKGIEDSDFVDFNFNLRRCRDDQRNYFENVSIKVFTEEKKKTIRITENLTFEVESMKFTDILDSPYLNDSLDFCHNENKNTLKDILNSNVAKIINL